MKIKEVEKATNLTAKAIRLYESKGLIAAGRQHNAYRSYDEEALRQLKEIRLYRMLGVGLSDLKLMKDNVISPAELLSKRLSELLREEESMKTQTEVLRRIQDSVTVKREKLKLDELLAAFQDTTPEDESRESLLFQEGKLSGNLFIGLDVGTTTLSAVILNGENGSAVDVYSMGNNTALRTGRDWEYVQDAEAIVRRSEDLLESILSSYPGVRAIGLTGQMHGIVYLDSQGEAVSPLYTWQDRRCDLPFRNGKTYAEIISQVTGCEIASGYGLATHFYNMQNGLVPPDAQKICTIMDYLAMKLTGRQAPLVHVSDAASFGLFDTEALRFQTDNLALLGIDSAILPEVTAGCDIVGKRRGIPVAAVIGDNQASFLGSVAEPGSSILVNIGTGSQISAMTKGAAGGGLDVRPYIRGQYLTVGSSLCGGRAYALLEKFYRRIAMSAGAPDKPLYSLMNRLAEDALESRDRLEVSTLFGGTRADPAVRGSIQNIGTENFTPEQLTLGFLQGIVSELHDLYRQMEGTLPEKPRCLVASGNGVRKNRVMQRLLAETFGMEVRIPAGAEEAAFGAALFAMTAAGSELDFTASNPLVKLE